MYTNSVLYSRHVKSNSRHSYGSYLVNLMNETLNSGEIPISELGKTRVAS